MSFRCISNIVQVELPPMDKVGSIIIPEEHKKKNKYLEGVIVGIGPGNPRKRDGQLVPTDLKVGDKVMIEPHKCLYHTEDGKHYAFTREPEIMCVLDKFYGNTVEKLWAKEGELTAPKDY